MEQQHVVLIKSHLTNISLILWCLQAHLNCDMKQTIAYACLMFINIFYNFNIQDHPQLSSVYKMVTLSDFLGMKIHNRDKILHTLKKFKFNLCMSQLGMCNTQSALALALSVIQPFTGACFSINSPCARATFTSVHYLYCSPCLRCLRFFSRDQRLSQPPRLKFRFLAGKGIFHILYISAIYFVQHNC